MAIEILAGTGAGSIATVAPAWPSHQADDIGILIIESTQTAIALDTANGFEAIASGNAQAGAATTIMTYIARATSGAMAAPVITDAQNHSYAVIVRIRGLDSATPLADLVNAIAVATKTVASTSASAPTVTTTLPGCVVINAITRDDDLAGASFSDWANSNLTSASEISDDGTTSGNGGGIGIYAGIMASAGATGATTATVASTQNASITIALNAPQGAETTVTPAQAALTLNGRDVTIGGAFNNVRIREVLVNASGQPVGNATDITLLVWYSGRFGGAPDISLNGLASDPNGTTSWSIATGSLVFQQPIAYLAQNSVSLSHYAAARMIPSYE